MDKRPGGMFWCNGPAAVGSLMRVLGMSRERAEKAVLDAGGSLTDQMPAWIRKELEEEGVIERGQFS